MQELIETIKNSNSPLNFVDQWMLGMNKTLKKLFQNEIKGSFLIAIMSEVIKQAGLEMFSYFDIIPTAEKFVSGSDNNAIQYKICCHIVGIHRANTIFINDERRRELEKDSEYRANLVKSVIEAIKLNGYGSVFFRVKRLKPQVDNFIYFPVPYLLFVLCMKAQYIMQDKNINIGDNSYESMLFAIMEKGMAILLLFEDCFLNSTYPLCRIIIELFAKVSLLDTVPFIEDKYNQFAKYDLMNTCCKGSEDETQFENLFLNRKYKTNKSKVDYIHFGFVDYIDNYDNISNPYSIYGILTYLRNRNNVIFDDLIKFYQFCNAYVHGNVVRGYPLLHYFEISIMLYLIITKTYKTICDKYNVDSLVNGIDVIQKLKIEYNVLMKQYNEKSTEKFDEYYKNIIR